MLHQLLRGVLGPRLTHTSGTLEVRGTRAPITITRDEHGVPYVNATCDEDAFYGMGFCHAQDRAFQIELYVRVARGTLSEIIGAEMLPVDRLSRRLGLAHIGRAQYALLEPSVQLQFEAFARGLNAGLRLGSQRLAHEFTLLRAEPSTFEPADILAILQFFAFALSSNWDAELARLRVLQEDGPEALAALEAADPSWIRGGSLLSSDIEALSAAERLLTDATTMTRVAGLAGASNQWVIAPSRTASGRPLLACDPHLPPTLPSPWYLIHIRTPTWAMSGAGLPSQPIVSFGHNEHVAWGLTAGHADNTDLFLERVDGDTVLNGDRYVPCEVREEVIRVKGSSDVRERVLVTRHGPLVSPSLGRGAALSIRGTWMAHRGLTGYDLYRARNVEEARNAYARYPGGSENRVMADVEGRILSQMVGEVPVRRKGNGMLPMPGWDPSVGWEDEPLPFEAMPSASDPAVGLLASANNRPTHAKGDAFLGADWLDAFRYERIVEQLATRSDWDVASCMRLQMDQTSILWRRTRAKILEALREKDRGMLERWDGVVSASSPAAAVFELLIAKLMVRAVAAKAPRAWATALGEGTNAVLPHGMMGLRRLAHLARCIEEQPAGWFSQGWPETIRESYRDVIAHLRSVAGDDPARWAWGTLRPLTLVHAVGAKPPMGSVFNVGPLPYGGDGTTIAQGSVPFTHPLENPIGIPNLRMVIDVGNWEASRYILAGGQSGNPFSPHYRDQVERWQRGEGIAIAWSEENVRRVARTELRLVPSA